MTGTEEERTEREREVLGKVAQALIERRLMAPAISFPRERGGRAVRSQSELT